MLEIDANKMKRVIEKSGLKQKYVSERIGMTETNSFKLSDIWEKTI